MNSVSVGQGGKTAWAAFGLTAFLLVWVSLCGAGFYWLYGHFADDPKSAAESLQWMTWPFVILAALGPIFMLIWMGGLRIVRDILNLQGMLSTISIQTQAIEKVPADLEVKVVNLEQTVRKATERMESVTTPLDERAGEWNLLAEKMTAIVQEFLKIRGELLADVSRVNSAIGEPQKLETEFQGAEGAAAHIIEFNELFLEAQKFFFGALGRYNATAQEPLIVRSGGGNFGEITETLRSGQWFRTKDPESNNKVASFVLRAFELERTTRGGTRSTMTAATVRGLRDSRPPPAK